MGSNHIRIAAALVIFALAAFGGTLLPAMADPAGHAAASGSLSGAAAEADIQQLQHAVRVARCITCTSIVTDPSTRNVYKVDALLAGKSGYRLSISEAGTQQALLVSDGKRALFYAPVTGKYFASHPQSPGFDASSAAMQFLNSAAGIASPDAVLAPVVLLQSANFVTPVPDPVDGIKQTFTVTASLGAVGGRAATISTQTLAMSAPSGPSVAMQVRVAYTKNPWSVRQITISQGRSVKSLEPQSSALYSDSSFSDSLPAAKAALFATATPARAVAFVPSVSPPGVMEAVLADGSVAPDFTVQTATKAPVKLSDYKGKVVVIDFWSTWCGPCQESLPTTSKIAARFASQGVVFMPVCVADTYSNFESWLPSHRKLGMTFLYDPAGERAPGFSVVEYKSTLLPTQFVIGKDGKVAASFIGMDPSDINDAALAKALRKAVAAP